MSFAFYILSYFQYAETYHKFVKSEKKKKSAILHTIRFIKIFILFLNCRCHLFHIKDDCLMINYKIMRSNFIS